ncbi:TM0106 family RecB-like putative nuclease [Piscirickettsia salmonis]|uniref:TM0106 family RecB-like putative nuclease n=1 Tax=Piscirickettsia salmonis TaxID=1238 RepID=UPI0006BCA2B4|nr:TM0106 family RecB-like putative nuclease [Piscirickettsia salmonis]ALA26699.1 helicase [Piscirickettsia salmonis]APS45901.1 helicase [Piscirickettsia salmonis]APS49287.1 helicase [Piscirickettsia salmonis]QGO82316.1 putative RecB family nuclease, family [Piscirickettsia salmonis]QGP24145.1 putative RecB family nuclease, family [Piscirickettsia salmonis]
MLREQSDYIFSPSDLTLYMESPFALWMNRYAKEYPDYAPAPDAEDIMGNMLQNKGDEHEQEILKGFAATGLNIADLSHVCDRQAATIGAMKEGVDIIYQGELTLPPFHGYPDFLVKKKGKSRFGNYQYQVYDTKLAKEIKAHFIIQLSCYSEMLAHVQDSYANEAVVILGNQEHKSFRINDYIFYYQALKSRFLNDQNNFDVNKQPNPTLFTSWGRWSDYAKQCLLEQDHLSQVAGVSSSQIKKLNAVSIITMQQLADTEEKAVPGINYAIFKRLKSQATIQKASIGKDKPLFEIIIPENGQLQGLALLPPTSPLDVFFDIEGYPLIEGGLEYLWGNTYFDESGARQFKDFWAHNEIQEKAAFQAFIQWVYRRWKKDPKMHIYHYANYEIAACRKLMSRYGICEYEVDTLLRNEVFVDLYKVVRGGVLLGEPRYSIKNVEHLYREQRDTEVGSGGDSVVAYEQWRSEQDGDTWETSDILRNLRDYNIDDCNSTQELVDWLRDQQQQNGIAYAGRTEVIEAEASNEANERTQFRDQLLRQAGDFPESAEDKLTYNLAWLIEFHRRESKPVFWRLFERLGLSHVELIDDLDCLACCERTQAEPYKLSPRKRKKVYEYNFDQQQEFKAGTRKYYLHGEQNDNGFNKEIELLHKESQLEHGMLSVEASEEPPHIITLIPNDHVRPDPIPEALFKQVKNISGQGSYACAALDFLERNVPKIKGHISGESIAASHNATQRLEQITQAVLNLDHSYLPIQGPPGAGKTYTGKHIIGELVKRGLRIGICSNSHKAINNLLIGTANYCIAQNIRGYFACTKDTGSELTEAGISILKNKDLASHIKNGCVVGTTAWGFSRDDMADQLDYLFIDEAGQVSVANLVAISHATKNLVLMGDQMQLGQPSQGTHPGESGLSVLDYLLHESPTIEDHMGVFLPITYRMHSKINQFISQAIYAGKLESNSDNDKQIIAVPKNYSGILNKEAGIIYVPVDHEGNSQASDEEVTIIKQLAEELLGRTFTEKSGKQRKITFDDILFVAPYNHQVNQLRNALGDEVKVGSVDKFQGQEAPIVFLSMAASSANESPRGFSFLFDKHRLNVAISRAQCLAIVVSSPSLAESQPANEIQMNMLNTFLRLTKS